MLIRNENASDISAIGRVVTEAFQLLDCVSGTEADIVENLRATGALTLSLVAEEAGLVCGYLAASPGRVGTVPGWVVLGLFAVLPSRQRQGIGTVLMQQAQRRLKNSRRGVALVGYPGFYRRFSFQSFAGLTVTGCPADVVLAKPFDGTTPRGELIHHPAFGLHQQG